MRFPNKFTPAVNVTLTISVNDTVNDTVVETITPADLEEVAINQVDDLVAAMTQTVCESIKREVQRAASTPSAAPATVSDSSSVVPA